MESKRLLAAVTGLLALSAASAVAHEIKSDKGGKVDAAFDVVRTNISTEGKDAVFRIGVSGKAGSAKPTPTGKLAGSTVYSYVWPTSLDSGTVGFDQGQGILALAVTSHPDFDDTPLQDENGDGRNDNDGDVWHSHWVVLVQDETCGPGALKVKDIPEGTKPKLPPTWPNLPILIDSPGYEPAIGGNSVEVRVPLERLGAVKGISFDGVTAALRVNASVHSPLLCVADVFDVASGNLSLPGKVE